MRSEESGEETLTSQPNECSGGGEPEMRCWFELAIMSQANADFIEGDARRKLLKNARLYYDKARILNPQRGEILNNLAQVCAELEEFDTAEALFRRAVAIDNDELQPFYRRNFGDYLTLRGRWADAANQYEQSLQEKPDDFQAHVSLVKILSDHKPADLPKYLWLLMERRRADWVEEVASASLRREDISEQSQQQYLTLLVQALADQSCKPDLFKEGTAASAIQELTLRPQIAELAREVLRLYAAESFDPAQYREWANGGRLPREAFGGLIKSIGQYFRGLDHLDQAEAYFLLAATLVPEEPDLSATRLLAEVASAKDDLQILDGVVTRNEPIVARSDASEKFDLYLYRHDIGLLYAHRQGWGAENSPASAIHQLKRAKELSELMAAPEPTPTPAFDARIYTRLAMGYSETRDLENARLTLNELAVAFRSQGMGAEADALQAVLNSGQARPHRPLDRRREFLDDPAQTRDFGTQPPGPPQ